MSRLITTKRKRKSHKNELEELAATRWRKIKVQHSKVKVRNGILFHVFFTDSNIFFIVSIFTKIIKLCCFWRSNTLLREILLTVETKFSIFFFGVIHGGERTKMGGCVKNLWHALFGTTNFWRIENVHIVLSVVTASNEF